MMLAYSRTLETRLERIKKLANSVSQDMYRLMQELYSFVEDGGLEERGYQNLELFMDFELPNVSRRSVINHFSVFDNVRYRNKLEQLVARKQKLPNIGSLLRLSDLPESVSPIRRRDLENKVFKGELSCSALCKVLAKEFKPYVPAKSCKTDGEVYVNLLSNTKAGNFEIKIGYAKDADRRARAMKTWVPKGKTVATVAASKNHENWIRDLVLSKENLVERKGLEVFVVRSLDEVVRNLEVRWENRVLPWVLE